MALGSRMLMALPYIKKNAVNRGLQATLWDLRVVLAVGREERPQS